MNGLINSTEDGVECPLCMELLEVDDLNFFPCTCGYQICRFCWHRIRTDENKLCPACRKEYPENPADFTPLTQEQMIAFKSQKRQRDQQRKQKITENRKHLANVRVVQKNLVFVVGLPPRLADADILKKHEYFGKYGKIHKVVINPSTTYAGVQGPSASAYVTYLHNSDALRAIQSVNNIMIDGRLIKTSLGTTKYCSHFMKNQQCPKGDCMYLHELGDQEASFTKEEMHQGKHQEYEKRLHDALIATSGANTAVAVSQTISPGPGSVSGMSKINASSSTSSALIATSELSQHKEAWPSLSTSPINSKDISLQSGSANMKSAKKEKFRCEKTRNEKTSKTRIKTNNNLMNISNKENHLPASENKILTDADEAIVINAIQSKSETCAHKIRSDRNTKNNNLQYSEESNQKIINSNLNFIDKENMHKGIEEQLNIKNIALQNHRDQIAMEIERSASPSSNNSDENSSALSDSSLSGKSSPGSFVALNAEKSSINRSETVPEPCNLLNNAEEVFIGEDQSKLGKVSSLEKLKNKSDKSITTTKISTDGVSNSLKETAEYEEKVSNTADTLKKLSLFDDDTSLFSSASFQQSLLLKNKIASELFSNQINNGGSSHLPDLLNGIDGYQKSTNTNEWEEAFKNVMIRNRKHVEEQLLHQQHLQYQQHHHHQQILQQQEEYLRVQELQKKKNHLNNIGLQKINGSQNDITRISQASLLQQQQQAVYQQNYSTNLTGNNLFGANMSKFFDFHKNQQINQQYSNGVLYLRGGKTPGNESFRLPATVEKNINNQFNEKNSLPQMQQKQRLGKYDSTISSTPQKTQKFSLSSSTDDDLGFDPFIETQKGLAELMENETIQQQNISNLPSINSRILGHQYLQEHENIQRSRMPPPGFNHVNTFGYQQRSFNHSNKNSPFINIASNSLNNKVKQQQQLAENNWSQPFPIYQQQTQLSFNDGVLQPQVTQSSTGIHKGCRNNDWTAMDPAILSFRQFSTHQSQVQIPVLMEQQPPEMYMPNPAQHVGQGFNQTQLSGINMPNNIHLTSPSSQSEVNANVQGMLEFLKSRQFV